MECVPAARAVVLNVAVPPAFNETFPRLVVPSKNLIEPVGTRLPDCGTTLAANVTLWPIAICVAEVEKGGCGCYRALRNHDTYHLRH